MDRLDLVAGAAAPVRSAGPFHGRREQSARAAGVSVRARLRMARALSRAARPRPAARESRADARRLRADAGGHDLAACEDTAADPPDAHASGNDRGPTGDRAAPSMER